MMNYLAHPDGSYKNQQLILLLFFYFLSLRDGKRDKEESSFFFLVLNFPASVWLPSGTTEKLAFGIPGICWEGKKTKKKLYICVTLWITGSQKTGSTCLAHACPSDETLWDMHACERHSKSLSSTHRKTRSQSRHPTEKKKRRSPEAGTPSSTTARFTRIPTVFFFWNPIITGIWKSRCMLHHSDWLSD